MGIGRTFSRRRWRITLVCAAVLAATALVTEACSCAAPSDPRTAWDEAAALFVGRVVAMELVVRQSEDPVVSYAVEDLLVRVVVSRVWKGPLVTETVVATTFTCCVCGFPFEIGESYLIYADRVNGLLRTDSCTRSAPLRDSEEDLAALGPGTAAADTVPLTTDEEARL